MRRPLVTALISWLAAAPLAAQGKPTIEQFLTPRVPVRARLGDEGRSHRVARV